MPGFAGLAELDPDFRDGRSKPKAAWWREHDMTCVYDCKPQSHHFHGIHGIGIHHSMPPGALWPYTQLGRLVRHSERGCPLCQRVVMGWRNAQPRWGHSEGRAGPPPNFPRQRFAILQPTCRADVPSCQPLFWDGGTPSLGEGTLRGGRSSPKFPKATVRNIATRKRWCFPARCVRVILSFYPSHSRILSLGLANRLYLLQAQPLGHDFTLKQFARGTLRNATYNCSSFPFLEITRL